MMQSPIREFLRGLPDDKIFEPMTPPAVIKLCEASGYRGVKTRLVYQERSERLERARSERDRLNARFEREAELTLMAQILGIDPAAAITAFWQACEQRSAPRVAEPRAATPRTAAPRTAKPRAPSEPTAAEPAPKRAREAGRHNIEIPKAEVLGIRRKYLDGETHGAIAKHYGRTAGHIDRICANQGRVECGWPELGVLPKRKYRRDELQGLLAKARSELA